MAWTIYCHTHTDSGRRYVGLTSRTWQCRWSQHVVQSRSMKGNRSHFANALRKYGRDAFSHEVLEICETVELANAAEEKWIEGLETRNPEKGFNLMRGGLHVPHPMPDVWSRPGFRENHKTIVKRAVSTPEQRTSNSLRMKLLFSDPRERERLSRQGKEVSLRPEIARRKRDLWKDPEHVARCSPQLHRSAAEQAARTHCPQGHPYSPENTIVGSGTHRGKSYLTRACRTCVVARTTARDKANPRPKSCACGAPIRRKSKRCNDCKYRSQFGKGEKASWPTLEELVKEVRTTSASAVARRLGVSYQAVTNRMKRHSSLVMFENGNPR